jgi:thioredoxin-related protein
MRGKIKAALSAALLAIALAITFLSPLAAEKAGVAGEDKLEAFLKTVKLPNVKNPPETPKVEPIIDDNGLYHQKWAGESFLDLREDVAEAAREGKRVMVLFEQKGCIYCKRFHADILSKKYINDYVRENFVIIQINMWGDREVTDFDGKVMSEKKLARRWGVFNTPTAYFMPDKVAQESGKTGRELAVMPAFYPGAFGPLTTFDLFVWVRIKGYETGVNFQRFHARRLKERGLG